jgi:hypothetical protein
VNTSPIGITTIAVISCHRPVIYFPLPEPPKLGVPAFTFPNKDKPTTAERRRVTLEISHKRYRAGGHHNYFLLHHPPPNRAPRRGIA